MRAPQIGFDQLVQDFFLRRLINERGASARTVESYRDGFELLFGFIEKRLAKPPSKLTMTDLDAPLILDFLDHLEIDRHNGARTRNARLAAIRSFMRYVALRDPASLAITTRVLAIPAKRFDRPVLGYLTRHEVAAILAAPDRNTWSGQRDAALLAVPTTPAPASLSSPAYKSDTCCSTAKALSTSTAKAANNESYRYGRPPPPGCGPGLRGSPRPPTPQYSPTETGLP